MGFFKLADVFVHQRHRLHLVPLIKDRRSGDEDVFRLTVFVVAERFQAFDRVALQHFARQIHSLFAHAIARDQLVDLPAQRLLLLIAEYLAGAFVPRRHLGIRRNGDDGVLGVLHNGAVHLFGFPQLLHHLPDQAFQLFRDIADLLGEFAGFVFVSFHSSSVRFQRPALTAALLA
ncbi:MAG: hypothetical protein BWY83_03309 [bacterium ADurb.Bin478]|nr:MAG: hypothetical protein BWY83_03309 [bacterium ADurb.Bin478]